MSEPRDVVCPACHKRAEQMTRVDEAMRRVAVRCRHFLQLHYPSFTVAWCPSCALEHNECSICGEPLP